MDKLGQWFATFHRIRPCFCCVSVRCRLGVAMGLSLLATNGAAEISLELVAEGFTQPVYLTHAADKRLFVVEQPGRIVQFVPSGTGTRVFLDIRKRVRSAGNEQGPLSVAFHPQFARNGRLFVNDTKAGGTTVVAEFSAGAARATAQPSSERVILEVKQPHGNHNDGQLQFGPDGFLYIGMGDGGAGPNGPQQRRGGA